jgi:hypothetical protein
MHSASSSFYYKEICYDVRSHERKKNGVKISMTNTVFLILV